MPTIDSRHVARAVALQQLFTNIPQTSETDPNQEVFQLADLGEILEADFDAALAEQIIAGVTDNQDRLDRIILKLAPDWPSVEQIAPVDLTILRMSIWEGFISKHTPERIVINEAIMLAQEFGGENSGAFINGVLGSLINRPELLGTVE